MERTKKKPVNERLLEQSLTINGLPLYEYNRLKEIERELDELKERLAECCKVDIKEAERKRKKYIELYKKVHGVSLEEMYNANPTKEQKEQLDILEKEWKKEVKNIQVIVDGNKAAAIFIKCATKTMTAEEVRNCTIDGKLQKETKVKIE